MRHASSAEGISPENLSFDGLEERTSKTTDVALKR